MALTEPTVIGAAYHEAGHVLLALHYGLDIGEIVIRENGDGNSDTSPSEHLPLLDRVAVCMGGAAAQQHFQAPATDHAMLADYAMVVEFTPEMTNEEREVVIEKGFVRARRVIAQNTDELARLAKILIEKRSINLNEIRPPLSLKPTDIGANR